MIHLYVKIHNQTGLKYFGKTIHDPYKYKGSGTYWRKHLKKHGYDVSTQIIGSFSDKNECLEFALKFSEENNIVNSNEWANLRVECLDGGDTSKTEGYINSIPKIAENARKSRWWNNGETQVFTEFPPNESFKGGRLYFNNRGALIGAKKQKGKTWINNGIEEKMLYLESILPEGYVKGRLKSKVFKKRFSAKGTSWWNNGSEERMSIQSPGPSYSKGRLKTKSQSQITD